MKQPRITRRSATAVTLPAVMLALTLYGTGVGSGGTNPLAKLPLAPLSTLGRLSASPAPGPLGPEDLDRRLIQPESIHNPTGP